MLRLRRLFRVRLLTILIGVTVLCILLNVYVTKARRQARSIAALRASGAQITMAAKANKGLIENMRQVLRDRIGGEYFDRVEEVKTYGEDAMFANRDFIIARRDAQKRFIMQFDSHLLPFPPFDDESLRPLENLSSLKRLQIRSGNGITNDGLSVLSDLHQLEKLEVFTASSTQAKLTGNCLVHISRLESVKYLDVSGVDLAEDDFQHFKRLTEIEILRVRDHGRSTLTITDVGAESLGQLTSLESVSVVQYDVTDKGLTRLSRLANLKELNLSRNQITDLGAQHVGKMLGLEKLVLNATDISDRSVTKFGELKKLEVLGLTGTEITDRSLAVLSKLPKLEKLYLSRTRVSDEGMKLLARSRTLKVLDVSQCKDVTDKSLSHLSSLPLVTLSLLGTRINDDAISRLKSAQPALRVR